MVNNLEQAAKADLKVSHYINDLEKEIEKVLQNKINEIDNIMIEDLYFYYCIDMKENGEKCLGIKHREEIAGVLKKYLNKKNDVKLISKEVEEICKSIKEEQRDRDNIIINYSELLRKNIKAYVDQHKEEDVILKDLEEKKELKKQRAKLNSTLTTLLSILPTLNKGSKIESDIIRKIVINKNSYDDTIKNYEKNEIIKKLEEKLEMEAKSKIAEEQLVQKREVMPLNLNMLIGEKLKNEKNITLVNKITNEVKKVSEIKIEIEKYIKDIKEQDIIQGIINEIDNVMLENVYLYFVTNKTNKECLGKMYRETILKACEDNKNNYEKIKEEIENVKNKNIEEGKNHTEENKIKNAYKNTLNQEINEIENYSAEGIIDDDGKSKEELLKIKQKNLEIQKGIKDNMDLKDIIALKLEHEETVKRKFDEQVNHQKDLEAKQLDVIFGVDSIKSEKLSKDKNLNKGKLALEKEKDDNIKLAHEMLKNQKTEDKDYIELINKMAGGKYVNYTVSDSAYKKIKDNKDYINQINKTMKDDEYYYYLGMYKGYYEKTRLKLYRKVDNELKLEESNYNLIDGQSIAIKMEDAISKIFENYNEICIKYGQNQVGILTTQEKLKERLEKLKSNGKITETKVNNNEIKQGIEAEEWLEIRNKYYSMLENLIGDLNINEKIRNTEVNEKKKQILQGIKYILEGTLKIDKSKISSLTEDNKKIVQKLLDIKNKSQLVKTVTELINIEFELLDIEKKTKLKTTDKDTKGSGGSKPGSGPDGSKPGSGPDGSKPGSGPGGLKPGSGASDSKPGSGASDSKPGSGPDGSKPGSGAAGEGAPTLPEDKSQAAVGTTKKVPPLNILQIAELKLENSTKQEGFLKEIRQHLESAAKNDLEVINYCEGIDEEKANNLQKIINEIDQKMLDDFYYFYGYNFEDGEDTKSAGEKYRETIKNMLGKKIKTDKDINEINNGLKKILKEITDLRLNTSLFTKKTDIMNYTKKIQKEYVKYYSELETKKGKTKDEEDLKIKIGNYMNEIIKYNTKSNGDRPIVMEECMENIFNYKTLLEEIKKIKESQSAVEASSKSTEEQTIPQEKVLKVDLTQEANIIYDKEKDNEELAKTIKNNILEVAKYDLTVSKYFDVKEDIEKINTLQNVINAIDKDMLTNYYYCYVYNLEDENADINEKTFKGKTIRRNINEILKNKGKAKIEDITNYIVNINTLLKAKINNNFNVIKPKIQELKDKIKDTNLKYDPNNVIGGYEGHEELKQNRKKLLEEIKEIEEEIKIIDNVIVTHYDKEVIGKYIKNRFKYEEKINDYENNDRIKELEQKELEESKKKGKMKLTGSNKSLKEKATTIISKFTNEKLKQTIIENVEEMEKVEIKLDDYFDDKKVLKEMKNHIDELESNMLNKIALFFGEDNNGKICREKIKEALEAYKKSGSTTIEELKNKINGIVQDYINKEEEIKETKLEGLKKQINDKIKEISNDSIYLDDEKDKKELKNKRENIISTLQRYYENLSNKDIKLIAIYRFRNMYNGLISEYYKKNKKLENKNKTKKVNLMKNINKNKKAIELKYFKITKSPFGEVEQKERQIFPVDIVDMAQSTLKQEKNEKLKAQIEKNLNDAAEVKISVEDYENSLAKQDRIQSAINTVDRTMITKIYSYYGKENIGKQNREKIKELLETYKKDEENKKVRDLIDNITKITSGMDKIKQIREKKIEELKEKMRESLENNYDEKKVIGDDKNAKKLKIERKKMREQIEKMIEKLEEKPKRKKPEEKKPEEEKPEEEKPKEYIKMNEVLVIEINYEDLVDQYSNNLEIQKLEKEQSKMKLNMELIEKIKRRPESEKKGLPKPPIEPILPQENIKPSDIKKLAQDIYDKEKNLNKEFANIIKGNMEKAEKINLNVSTYFDKEDKKKVQDLQKEINEIEQYINIYPYYFYVYNLRNGNEIIPGIGYREEISNQLKNLSKQKDGIKLFENKIKEIRGKIDKEINEQIDIVLKNLNEIKEESDEFLKLEVIKDDINVKLMKNKVGNLRNDILYKYSKVNLTANINNIMRDIVFDIFNYKTNIKKEIEDLKKQIKGNRSPEVGTGGDLKSEGSGPKPTVTGPEVSTETIPVPQPVQIRKVQPLDLKKLIEDKIKYVKNVTLVKQIKDNVDKMIKIQIEIDKYIEDVKQQDEIQQIINDIYNIMLNHIYLYFVELDEKQNSRGYTLKEEIQKIIKNGKSYNEIEQKIKEIKNKNKEEDIKKIEDNKKQELQKTLEKEIGEIKKYKTDLIIDIDGNIKKSFLDLQEKNKKSELKLKACKSLKDVIEFKLEYEKEINEKFVEQKNQLGNIEKTKIEDVIKIDKKIVSKDITKDADLKNTTIEKTEEEVQKNISEKATIMKTNYNADKDKEQIEKIENIGVNGLGYSPSDTEYEKAVENYTNTITKIEQYFEKDRYYYNLKEFGKDYKGIDDKILYQDLDKVLEKPSKKINVPDNLSIANKVNFIIDKINENYMNVLIPNSQKMENNNELIEKYKKENLDEKGYKKITKERYTHEDVKNAVKQQVWFKNRKIYLAMLKKIEYPMETLEKTRIEKRVIEKRQEILGEIKQILQAKIKDISKKTIKDLTENEKKMIIKLLDIKNKSEKLNTITELIKLKFVLKDLSGENL